MKKLIRKVFRKLGYEIVPAGSSSGVPAKNPFTMAGMLRRCQVRNFEFNTIVDVGASNGMWAKPCVPVYPNAYYLLIEAQEVHLEGLKQFKQANPNSDFVIAAAGSREGKIYFDASDPLGGIASETPMEGNCISVDVTTIDNEVKKRGLKGPFLIKLDTHGFEVPILEGAEETLKQANALIIEVYNYHLTNDSLLFYELCAYMDKKGFRPFDMGDLMLRSRDHSLWQMDMLFVPKSRAEFSYNQFK